MFFTRRPSRQAIERFLEDVERLPLSYGRVGIAATTANSKGGREELIAVGSGEADYERARAALAAWKQFDTGWVELVPPGASIEVGTVVAVLIRHFARLWSLSGCRVVYQIGDREQAPAFGVAYGTLVDQAEVGERLFEVSLDPRTGEVLYRSRAALRPRLALMRLGEPVLHLLHARFLRDSAEAMRRAINRDGVKPTDSVKRSI